MNIKAGYREVSSVDQLGSYTELFTGSNIPVSVDIDLLSSQNTSSFYSLVDVGAPSSVQNNLLELHFAFLTQARSLLRQDGRVLCSIGCRRPLHAILDMVRLAGYTSNVLIYTWKMQSEAEDVIEGYARQQRQSPNTQFWFYSAETLEIFFDNLPPFMNTGEAIEIENKLLPYAIDAEEALTMLKKGIAIGHVTTVIEAMPI